MTPPPSTAPTRGPLAPLGVAVAVLAVGAVAIAIVRPWGDVGVTSVATLSERTPVFAVVVLAVGAVAALVVALGYLPARARHAREIRLVGAVVVAIGAFDLVVVLGIVRAQVLPRDGGWWGLLAAIAVVVAGIAVVVSPSVRPTGRRGNLVVLAVCCVVPLGLVIAGAVVAPGWSQHRLDASYPASFSESPGPATVTRVAWRQEFGPGSTAAVLGGRAVVARDVSSGRTCALEVQALDAGTGEPVWSVTRPLRCDGPRLVTLDGDNQVVRLTLRGDPAGGPPRTGPQLYLYLELESGRPLAPSAASDAVVAWTEGFGIVVTDTELRGLDPRTGVTVWARTLPRCSDGRPVQVGLPSSPPADGLGSRSPYDGARPPGAVPLVGAGRYLVAGTLCSAEGGTGRKAWLVNTAGNADDDHTVDLPAVANPAASTVATAFLPWLDTVVAAVPATGGGAGDAATTTALAGIDLATGRLLWQRDPAPVSAIDLSVTTGDVEVSEASPDVAVPPHTVLLDVRSGAVLGDGEDPGPVLAAVALTAGRVELTLTTQVTVTAPVTGEPLGTIDLGECRVPVGQSTAPMLAGPGGVVVQCLPTQSSGAALLGLVA